jgi:hypothetical protein
MRFDRPITLENGLRVRFRLPHAADRRGLQALFARGHSPIGELHARRLLRFEPRGRVALCAVAPVGGRESLVGFAAAAPGGGPPEVVLADEAVAPGMSLELRDRVVQVAAQRAA